MRPSPTSWWRPPKRPGKRSRDGRAGGVETGSRARYRGSSAGSRSSNSVSKIDLHSSPVGRLDRTLSRFSTVPDPIAVAHQIRHRPSSRASSWNRFRHRKRSSSFSSPGRKDTLAVPSGIPRSPLPACPGRRLGGDARRRPLIAVDARTVPNSNRTSVETAMQRGPLSRALASASRQISAPAAKPAAQMPPTLCRNPPHRHRADARSSRTQPRSLTSRGHSLAPSTRASNAMRMTTPLNASCQ
jgi:hypothetical protein